MMKAAPACLEVLDKFIGLVLDFFDCVGDLERVGVVNKTLNRIVAGEGRIRRRVVARFFDMLDASPERLREVVATRGQLLKALVKESKVKPGFFRAVRDLDVLNPPKEVLNNFTELAMHDAGIHAPGMTISYENDAYGVFLDDIVLTLVTTPDLLVVCDFDDEMAFRVKAGQSTFFFNDRAVNAHLWFTVALLSNAISKLAGLTKLDLILSDPIWCYGSFCRIT